MRRHPFDRVVASYCLHQPLLWSPLMSRFPQPFVTAVLLFATSVLLTSALWASYAPSTPCCNYSYPQNQPCYQEADSFCAGETREECESSYRSIVQEGHFYCVPDAFPPTNHYCAMTSNLDTCYLYRECVWTFEFCGTAFLSSPVEQNIVASDTCRICP